MTTSVKIGPQVPRSTDTFGLKSWSQGVFCCPLTGSPLDYYHDETGEGYRSSLGLNYPCVRGIPRFVDGDLYVNSFSRQWNTHQTTQIDSRSGTEASEEQFRAKTGLTPKDVKGKLVLDAGVGAGRFLEVLARWGANVIGIDLSFAVEAAHKNFKNYDNVLIAQADIGKLPFKSETFDLIISIGVLHHTPCTKNYFKKLVPLLKSKGTIAIWVYPKTEDYITRNEWIKYTNKIPDQMFYHWCSWFVPLANRFRLSSHLVQWITKVFPFSFQGHGDEFDILDTFDGYSPRFHGIHSAEEVSNWFNESGLINIYEPGEWKTSVRGTKP